MNTKQSTSHYADLTERPKIFAGTYWGGFSSESLPDPVVVQNRNNFDREYNLLKFVGSECPNLNHRFFDHCELYKCRSGYTYIVSPYDRDHKTDALSKQFGMKKYTPLYNLRACTYIKIFPNKISFNRWIREINKSQG